jgi:predicted site-specific integrase-resolvase
LTTTEAADLLGIDPKSFARWARHHGIVPVHRVRVGRSTVTAWSMAQLAAVTAP